MKYLQIMPFSFNNVSAISTLLDFFTHLNGLLLKSEVINTGFPFAQQAGEELHAAFNPGLADTTFTNFLQIQAIGQGLYTYGATWLLVCSIILLLAMVAPIFISRMSTNN